MKFNKSVAKSIFGSATFKLSSAAISLVTIPMLLKTLGTESYAVWVTVTALLAWLNLFDFGSGYSLKNKVTELSANNDKDQLGVLIAGTLQFYMLMTAVLMLVFVGSTFFVGVFKNHLSLSLIIYLPIIISFPFTLGHFIIQGAKKFNLFNSILFGQNIIWLIVVIMYKSKLFEVNIYKLAIFYSALYVIANAAILIFSLKGLNFEWKQLFDFENFKASKSSLLTGLKFFVLQVSGLFLYSIGNVLTYSHLSLKDVAQYDTVNKIFLLGMTFFNILINVFWSEISHAKAIKDKARLFKIYSQLMLYAGVFTVGSVIVVFFIPTIVSLWTGNSIVIADVKTLYPFAFLISVQVFAYSGAVFLNAFEQLGGQIFFSAISASLMLPVTNYFFSQSVGIGSVPLASAVLSVPTLIYVVIKSRRLIIKLV